MVAIVYNWWSLFIRLARADKHLEAITSRPLLLHGVARQTKHAGQTTLTITSHHAKARAVQAAVRALNSFLGHVRRTAEQLRVRESMVLVTRHAFRFFLGTTQLQPLLQILTETG